jgi:uncharacterized membrane protein
MSGNWNAGNALGIVSWGHLFFAVTMIGLGVISLVQGDFTPTWGGVPKGFPTREALARGCAVISLVTGLGLLSRRWAGLTARILLIVFLTWLVAFRVSHVPSAPALLGVWWGCGDTAVMAAAAWVLAVWLGDRGGPLPSLPSFALGEQGLGFARRLYGLAMIPFGVAHFLFLKETATLVPSWLPAPVAIAAFTGVAFLAAGVAILLNLWARLAATLSAIQIALFTLVVWVPVVAAGPNAFQWSEFVDSWALTAGAWVVAESYRGAPWRAVRAA